MNRLPSPIDIAIMIGIAAVFLIGCIQTGIWIGEAVRALACWIFP